MHLPPHLLRWARAHHQLVTRAAWIGAGLSDRSFDRAVEAGVLVRMAANVAILRGADPFRPEARIAAVVLASPRSLLGSHRTAAHLWGGPVSGVDPIEVMVRDRTTATRAPGVVVHRPVDGQDVRTVVRRGIPCTDPFRTLLDLGASDAGAVAPFLESLLIAGTVTVPGVAAALSRHRRRGRSGTRALAEALDQLPLGARPPDSVLEAMVAALLDRHGLGGWVFHLRIGGFEVDFAFPDEQLVLEVDGWQHHGSRQAFEGDRARDAALVALGWAVIRVTWRQVTGRPGHVARLVGEALARRR